MSEFKVGDRAVYLLADWEPRNGDAAWTHLQAPSKHPHCTLYKYHAKCDTWEVKLDVPYVDERGQKHVFLDIDTPSLLECEVSNERYLIV